MIVSTTLHRLRSAKGPRRPKRRGGSAPVVHATQFRSPRVLTTNLRSSVAENQRDRGRVDSSALCDRCSAQTARRVFAASRAPPKAPPKRPTGYAFRRNPLIFLAQCWSGRRDSNSRPLAPHASALPGCATPRRKQDYMRCPCPPFRAAAARGSTAARRAAVAVPVRAAARWVAVAGRWGRPVVRPLRQPRRRVRPAPARSAGCGRR